MSAVLLVEAAILPLVQIDLLTLVTIVGVAVAAIGIIVGVVKSYFDNEKQREARMAKFDSDLKAKADKDELTSLREFVRNSGKKFSTDTTDFVRAVFGTPEFDLALQEGYEPFSPSTPGQMVYLKRPRRVSSTQSQRAGTARKKSRNNIASNRR